MTKSYSVLQIALHWAIAVLIFANYIISDDMGRAFYTALRGEVVSDWTVSFHVWVGVSVLVLAMLRLLVRQMSGGWHEEPSNLADKAALWGHRALYALMVLVPTLGVIAWFGGVAVSGDLHVIAMNAMMLLVLGHSAMALYHQFVVKDGLLLKMMRPR
jgi:cytochrome b561